jgi:hypothetical protein
MAANGSNVSVVASSASAVQLLAANTLRRKDASGPSVVIANASTAILYILLSDGASGEVSATRYTYQIAANGAPQEIWGYSGQIRGIWASANGQAAVTELT